MVVVVVVVFPGVLCVVLRVEVMSVAETDAPLRMRTRDVVCSYCWKITL